MLQFHDFPRKVKQELRAALRGSEDILGLRGRTCEVPVSALLGRPLSPAAAFTISQRGSRRPVRPGLWLLAFLYRFGGFVLLGNIKEVAPLKEGKVALHTAFHEAQECFQSSCSARKGIGNDVEDYRCSRCERSAIRHTRGTRPGVTNPSPSTRDEQVLSLGRLGYTEAGAKAILDRAKGAIHTADDVRRVIESFGYELPPQYGYLTRPISAISEAGGTTCFEAALIAYDLLGLASRVRKLLTITRIDPRTQEYLGHAVAIYTDETLYYGSIGFSRLPTQCSRPQTYRTEEEITLSYLRAYCELGFVPLRYGIHVLEEIGSGLDWHNSTADLRSLHQRLLDTQVYQVTLENAHA